MADSNDFAMGYAMGNDNSRNNDCCNGNGMFGGDWIWAFLIFALFGWGGGGFGGFGGGNAAQGALTRADLCQDMNFQGLENGVRGIQQGLCDGFYAMNTGLLNGFNGLQRDLCSGFNSVTQGITQARFDNQQCCCETQRMLERGFCDVIQANNTNTQRIVDMYTQDKIEALRDQLQTANFQLSQQAQSANLINQLRPTPTPAYLTCSPYESAMMYSGCGGYGWGRSNCGCNNCGC